MTERQAALYYAAFDPASGASHCLLRQALARCAPETAELPLRTGAYGKPYFPDAPQVHFSISHSGAYWLCAVSGAPVGLDIQQHRPCRAQALAQRFFSPEENAYLQKTDGIPFFDLWCAKESYLKYTGQGLSGLETVCTVSPEGAFPSVPGVWMKLLPLFAGYSACICTQGPVTLRVEALCVAQQ